MLKWITQFPPLQNLVGVSEPNRPQGRLANDRSKWTKGICPNCSYANADVDAEGVLWCPACGYSKKGCYT